jgi:glutaredoxin 3
MAKVEIYTTNYCPYCVRAKMLLNSKKAAFTEIEVSSDKDRQDLVKKSNGMRTVPQIFINDNHIGGFDDLNKLNDEKKLDELLK